MGAPVSKKVASIQRDALWLGIYLLFLFGTVPVMPQVWETLRKTGIWTEFLPEGIGIFLVLSTLRMLIKQETSRILLKTLLFISLATLFIFSMACVKRPVEQIHFSQYGVLAFLLFRYLRHRVPLRSLYAWTFLGVCLIGLLDECLQGLVPRRFFDPRDLGFNAAAGGFGLAGVVLLFDPFFAR